MYRAAGNEFLHVLIIRLRHSRTQMLHVRYVYVEGQVCVENLVGCVGLQFSVYCELGVVQQHSEVLYVEVSEKRVEYHISVHSEWHRSHFDCRVVVGEARGLEHQVRLYLRRVFAFQVQVERVCAGFPLVHLIEERELGVLDAQRIDEYLWNLCLCRVRFLLSRFVNIPVAIAGRVYSQKYGRVRQVKRVHAHLVVFEELYQVHTRIKLGE